MTETKIKGVLKTWKADKGFGFIKPDNGGQDIFIHISSLKRTGRRPVKGDVIYYQIAKDNQGKFKAVNAAIEGIEAPSSKKRGGLKFNKWLWLTLILLMIAGAGAFFYIRH